MKKPKPEPDDNEQSERFIETARMLEVDESGESFERTIKLIGSKPASTPKPSRKAGR